MARSFPVSVAFLIATNMVPLFGALFFGWDVATILFTYWLENGIVGLLNIPKILLVMRASGEPFSAVNILTRVGFFTVVYAIFWVVHGVFLMVLTGREVTGTLDPLGYVVDQPEILFAAALLLVSHLVSLWVNFIGRGEYKHNSVDLQPFSPFPRMVILHVTVILGGFAIWVLGQPVLLVALLVVLKTLLDLGLHLISHANAAARAQGRKGPKGIETTRAG